jgi:hypothetical protein
VNTDEATEATQFNRAAIERSLVVSCMFCEEIYPSGHIKRWTDDGRTAICPYCEVDAVLPGAINAAALHILHDRIFPGDARSAHG